MAGRVVLVCGPFGVEVVVVVASLQPNHPGVLQVVVLVTVGTVIDVVGAGEGSLQPNQPGVLQVVVELVVVGELLGVVRVGVVIVGTG